MTQEEKGHAGAVVVGIILFFILVHGLYVGHYRFASLNAILLVVLALGCEAIN